MPKAKHETFGVYDSLKKKHYPALAAFEYFDEENGRSGLAAWCPWCVCWHYHSHGDGHREAHCRSENSPFRCSGYVLKTVKLPQGFVVKRFKTR